MLLVQRCFFHRNRKASSFLNEEEDEEEALDILLNPTVGSLRAGVTLLPFFAVNWFLSVLAIEDTPTTAAFQSIFAISNVVFSFLVFLFLCHQTRIKPPSTVSTLILTRLLFLQSLEEDTLQLHSFFLDKFLSQMDKDLNRLGGE